MGEDERSVAQASALLFTSMRMTYMVGPALAGALIAVWGAPTVLLIDAASFLIAGVLLLVFIPSVERPPRERSSPGCWQAFASSVATRSFAR